MFYLGKFNHTLDAKNRLFVPARFREKLGADFVLFKMPEDCLALYDSENFEKLIEQVYEKSETEESREAQRNFFDGALSVTQDKQGRFTVPQDFIEYANLGEEVLILGAANRLEIWNKERYEKSRQLTGENNKRAMPNIRY